jgi:hypothetical protein
MYAYGDLQAPSDGLEFLYSLLDPMTKPGSGIPARDLFTAWAWFREEMVKKKHNALTLLDKAQQHHEEYIHAGDIFIDEHDKDIKVIKSLNMENEMPVQGPAPTEAAVHAELLQFCQEKG